MSLEQITCLAGRGCVEKGEGEGNRSRVAGGRRTEDKGRGTFKKRVKEVL